MLTSIRRSLSTTAMAMTPFLLSACGGDDTNTQQKFEAVVLAALLLIAATLQTVLRSRSRAMPNARA